MQSLFDLTGKVAIVTGGNGGIGLGMAKGLATAGAAIVVAGRNAAKSSAAVAELDKAGAKALAIQVDVASESSLKELVAQTVTHFGRLDILVNNAGINIRKTPEQLSLEEWKQVVDTNLTSTFLASNAAHPAMQKSGGGKIINIGSMFSIFGAPFVPAYAASKGGVVQLTKAFACALAKDNIQVNAVLPGWIDTDLTKAARAQVPGINERILSRSPSGRWGVPDDLAGIAVFLASRASDFITGTAIPVDGGWSISG